MSGSSGVFYEVGDGKDKMQLIAGFSAIDGEALEFIRSDSLRLATERSKVHMRFFRVGDDFNYPKPPQVLQMIGKRNLLRPEGEDPLRMPGALGDEQMRVIHFLHEAWFIEEYGEAGHLVVQDVRGKLRLALQWDAYPLAPNDWYAAREPHL